MICQGDTMVKQDSRDAIRKTVLSALFIAVGLVLPFFTAQIPQIGNLLLPMHIPVLLCGFVCGWQYGISVGAVLPLLRSLMFSMPQLYPNALAMSAELATYGFVCGIMYNKMLRKQNILTIYISLVSAMLAGRIVWGIAEAALLGIGVFTPEMFVAGAFINAVPGIILQLVFIPALLEALNRAGVIPFRTNN